MNTETTPAARRLSREEKTELIRRIERAMFEEHHTRGLTVVTLAEGLNEETKTAALAYLDAADRPIHTNLGPDVLGQLYLPLPGLNGKPLVRVTGGGHDLFLVLARAARLR